MFYHFDAWPGARERVNEAVCQVSKWVVGGKALGLWGARPDGYGTKKPTNRNLSAWP